LQQHESKIPARVKSKTNNGRFDLWFYQKIGERWYFRVTPFGLIVFILLTLIPVVLLLTLWLVNTSTPNKEVNVNINVPKASPTLPDNTIIKQIPQPTPMKSR